MFKYVRRVRFELHEHSVHGSAAVSDVAGWLLGARERGIERFWLCIPRPGVVIVGDDAIPNRDLVAFVGGGNWFLLGTSHERFPEVWRASWTIADKDADDSGIWEVEYRGENVDDGAVPPRPNMSASEQRLTVALNNAEAFARTQELRRWAIGLQKLAGSALATSSRRLCQTFFRRTDSPRPLGSYWLWRCIPGSLAGWARGTTSPSPLGSTRGSTSRCRRRSTLPYSARLSPP
jgi:hypothetical protein